MYVVLDTSKFHADTNQLPPAYGDYSFTIGDLESINIRGSTLKNAVNQARREARATGNFRVTLMRAVAI